MNFAFPDMQECISDIVFRYAHSHGGLFPKALLASSNLRNTTNLIEAAKILNMPIILVENNSSIIGAFDFTVTYIN